MIPTKLKRIKKFEKMGVGLFIHWGIYSQMEAGEWVQFAKKIPTEEYKKLSATFDAEKFDARAIAKFASENGIRYIVLTTRHHDGFSLYDTKGLSTFDVMHSACGRDLVREFTDACREFSVSPFLYHTTIDWNEPTFESDFDKYLEYLRKSVELLCTNYGEIGGFWFDGNWSRAGNVWKEDELYSTIRKHQPETIIINNSGLYSQGTVGHPEIDSVTYEQGLPTAPDREGMAKYYAGEMCQTVNSHWGAARDFHYKSSAEIIENLCSCRRFGANYLINIGLAADGTIIPMQRELIRAMGEWIRIYGQGFYDIEPTTYTSQGKNFILDSGDHSYAFVFGLGCFVDSNVTKMNADSTLRVFAGINRKIISVSWIDSGEDLEFLHGLSDNALLIKTTPFPYGTNYVVRVAKILYQN